MFSLNGWWNYSTNGMPVQKRLVPSNHIAVGLSNWEREFAFSPQPGKRYFLHFDGIQCTGTVRLNGQMLGEMFPFVAEKFEVTTCLQAENLLQVDIRDFDARFGPTYGWETYGGIPRDVYIEETPATYIADVFFQSDRFGCCTTNITLDGEEAGQLTVSLKGEYTQTVPVTADNREICLEISAPDLVLWSPEMPYLYDLVVSFAAGESTHTVEKRVGIREFKVVGNRFHLNGKPYFLKGVARHEFWEGQGTNLTPEQIRLDITLIKNMGGNFVRLVHYPHCEETLKICDELGMLVSEEPALWWSDMANPQVREDALNVMGKTILRDRSHPSAAIWILYNECKFDGLQEYLTQGKALCDSLDGTRPVSAANNFDAATARDIFNAAGMDFHCIHPYSYEPNYPQECLDALGNEKPVLFTEWGAFFIVHNPNLVLWFKRFFRRQANNPLSPLSGISWWEFMDAHQYSRGLPGALKGSMTEGLVNPDRSVRPMYSVMAEFFRIFDGLEIDCQTELDLMPLTTCLGGTPVSLDALRAENSQKAAWDAAREDWRVRLYSHLEKELKVNRVAEGPTLDVPVYSLGRMNVNLSGKPLILAGECSQVEIPVGLQARRVHFIGHAMFMEGFPIRGKHGETAARYVLRFAGGRTQTVELRHGIELLSGSMLAMETRIDPQSPALFAAMEMVREPDFERYRFYTYAVDVEEGTLESITFERVTDEFSPMLYGITVE